MLVGDPAQLPSIGPGQVLSDLLASGRVPVTELTTLYRQAEGGAIARLATAVRGGELRAGGRHRPGGRRRRRPPASAQAAHRTVQLVTDSIPRALGIAADDVQVVTPVHRGPAGTIDAQPRAQGGAQPRQRAPSAGSTPATGWSPPPTTSTSNRSASPTARWAW
ncbi:MAG: AAA family ATPase [Candidatus Limnocylindrales bacterium]